MIGEFGTYTVDRFIPFTAESYFRLFERQHATLGAAQVALVAAGLAAAVFAVRGNQRVTAILLAFSFAAAACLFHFQLYAELTPVGTVFGWLFLFEAALLLAWGFLARDEAVSTDTFSFRLGLVLVVAGLAVHPLLAPLGKQSFAAAQIFGAAPDPTVCATLGLLLIAARPGWLFVLMPLPLLWCAVSGATLQVIESPLAWLIGGASATAVAGVIAKAATGTSRPRSRTK